MKQFFTVLALLTFSICALAESYRSLAVSLADGTAVEICLTDDLTASFSADNFIVTGGGQNVSVPRSSIKSFAFSTKEVSALETVGSETYFPMIGDNRMSFSSLPAGSVITIYDTAGKLLNRYEAEGEFTLDLSTLPAGTVIVNVNNVAYKIAANR